LKANHAAHRKASSLPRQRSSRKDPLKLDKERNKEREKGRGVKDLEKRIPHRRRGFWRPPGRKPIDPGEHSQCQEPIAFTIARSIQRPGGEQEVQKKFKEKRKALYFCQRIRRRENQNRGLDNMLRVPNVQQGLIEKICGFSVRAKRRPEGHAKESLSRTRRL